ncbi:hypothetical protein L7F22_018672 [Adiantum nelumboides]|nr:hypothetical protein [Adiantum nelumboides]
MQAKHALTQHHNGKPSPWEWLQEVDLQALEGQLNGAAGTRVGGRPPRSRLHVWLIRLSTSILLWTCLIQLMALAQLWHPHLLWPPCLDNRDLHNSNQKDPEPLPSSSSSSTFASAVDPLPSTPPSVLASHHAPFRLPRVYKNNGYLLVSCNGGLNQMRSAICDMVAIARHLNLTLVVPELDKASFWADQSEFGDIFDVFHFIESLRDEVKVIKQLPSKFKAKVASGAIISMPPVSWSNESYYLNQILPLVKKHKVLHFSKTDARLANSGLSLEMQKLRCKVNFEALKFTPHIEELGRKLVKFLHSKGPFLVLHLRYEMDMLAFSGCTHGCTATETEELTKMRYAYPWWKEKVIDSEQKRLDGLCPLTPEETTLVLKALGFDKDIQIYIAAGEIYGSDRRMAPLYVAYPNTVKKETILSPEELEPFQNHSSQMAALDYLVALESNVFVPTYDGNMAKVVEGHRRFLGYKQTILLDRKKIVQLVNDFQSGDLKWDDFSVAIRDHHSQQMGAPRKRLVIPDRPKEEDYFYSNPEECLA